MERSDIDRSERDVPRRGVSGGEHQTPVRYLVPGSGKAQLGYLWVANDPGGNLFYHWGVGRGRDQLVETIGKDFFACHAHMRRNFIETLDAGSDQGAAQIVRLIAHLYFTEKELRETKSGPTLRESERAWRAAPIVARIKSTMKVLLPKHRPKRLMGKALAYGLRHWDLFAGYLADGRLEIDNNLVENAMRPVKPGAKNWLFFGSKNAGHQAETIYTIVENCRRHGVPVEA